MYVLAINGSHNLKGNTELLLRTVSDECTVHGIRTNLLNAYEAVCDCKNPFCVECVMPCNGICYRGTKLETLFEEMQKADAIIFGSPVYFGGMTAPLKSLFDKGLLLRSNNALYNKFGAVVAVGASPSGGQEATIHSIHNALLIQGMIIVGDGFEESGMGHFGVRALRPADKDNNALARAKSLGKRISALISQR